MPDYRINVGNSNTGPVGFVASLTAGSAEAALEKLKRVLPEVHEVKLQDVGIGYLNVYFNAEAITLKDVEVDD